MPGYTHLQRAQPVTFAHHLMAYVQMFLRDQERLTDCYQRMDIMPLGSGALAGTTYPLDRHAVAQELGFERITENSLDGVSDRDFVLELASALSIVMMHLSRFCEEIILWCSHDFPLSGWMMPIAPEAISCLRKRTRMLPSSFAEGRKSLWKSDGSAGDERSAIGLQ